MFDCTCGSVGNQVMYPATFLFKSRSVTSFDCRALALCTRMTRTSQFTGALNHGSRKQVPFAPCCFLRACGLAGFEPKASPWVTSLLWPRRWTGVDGSWVVNQLTRSWTG